MSLGYADRHCAQVVDDGAHKLSVALAKIMTSTSQMGRGRMNRGQRGQVSNVRAFSNFKALFIADPDTAAKDAAEVQMMRGGSDQDIVQRVLSWRVSTFDSITEIFSTHPNIVKRLRALQALEQ